MAGLTQKAIGELKVFIDLLKKKPEILHAPQLSFFREYLESLGAKIPSPPKPTEEEKVEEVKTEGAKQTESHTHEKPKTQEQPKEPEKKPTPPPEEEKVEPDPELISAESEEPNFDMGDANKSVTEEEEGDAMSLMSEGRSAYRNKDYDAAVAKYTEAIKKNPKGAVLFASRAETFLAQKKLKAAVKDAKAALSINPDSSKALKVHGKALRYLGEYEQAFKDLSHGNQLDYDDETDAMIKSIKERVEKLVERRRKAEIRKQEEDLEDRKKKAEERRKAAEEARKRQEEEEEEMGDMGDMPGMGGMGGMGGGMGGLPPEFMAAFQDPEVQAAMNDPATLQKLMSVLQDPSKAAQYANDPKLARVIQKLSILRGGAAGGAAGGQQHQPHDHSHDDHDHPHPHQHKPHVSNDDVD